MSEASNKAVILRIYEEVFNQHKFDLIDALYQSDVQVHDPYIPAETIGTNFLKELCQAYREAFPDLHYQVCELIADGDKVATQWQATGTHLGPVQIDSDQYIKPSGETISVSGISLARFSEGKVAEIWQVVDMLGAFKQMKAVELKADTNK